MCDWWLALKQATRFLRWFVIHLVKLYILAVIVGIALFVIGYIAGP